VSSWWSEHPDLERVARRGRTELGEEAIAAEQDTELLRKRRRTLEQLCFEWMSRGDLVTIVVAGHSFEGKLTATVNDLAVMNTKTIDVAINTTLIGLIRSDKRAGFEGTTGDRAVSSFRAQLGRYEVDATPVRLIGDSFDIIGVIEASTDDHVLIRDSQSVEWALPRTQIACAISQ
jgi:hypothetical protein